MITKEMGALQNDLDSCRGHMLIGANFFSLVELLIVVMQSYFIVYNIFQGERGNLIRNSYRAIAYPTFTNNTS